MGYFRTTSTEVMRRKPHTRCGKVQLYVADTKGRSITVDVPHFDKRKGQIKNFEKDVICFRF